MAQRKSAPANRPNRPAAKPGSKPAAKVSTSKPTAAKSGAAKVSSTAKAAPAKPSAASAAKKAPPRKPGKSIVNQKQTPWGLIATTAAIVVFAVAVIAVVVLTKKDDTAATTTSTGGQAVDPTDKYRQPALAAAMKIPGVTYRVEGEHNHVGGVIKYDSSPPRGGNHDPYWANCNGAVYDHQIANENAVHMLEHGAVWITYNPKTATKADVAALTKYVAGQDRLALSPYVGLKTKISLQAWGYQLFVSSASDPRIAEFIATLKYNSKTTPEPTASCTDPYWTATAAKESTLGHPWEGP